MGAVRQERDRTDQTGRQFARWCPGGCHKNNRPSCHNQLNTHGKKAKQIDNSPCKQVDIGEISNFCRPWAIANPPKLPNDFACFNFRPHSSPGPAVDGPFLHHCCVPGPRQGQNSHRGPGRRPSPAGGGQDRCVWRGPRGRPQMLQGARPTCGGGGTSLQHEHITSLSTRAAAAGSRNWAGASKGFTPTSLRRLVFIVVPARLPCPPPPPPNEVGRRGLRWPTQKNLSERERNLASGFFCNHLPNNMYT